MAKKTKKVVATQLQKNGLAEMAKAMGMSMKTFCAQSDLKSKTKKVCDMMNMPTHMDQRAE